MESFLHPTESVNDSGVPDPVDETEIAEMKQLYDYGPERACLDRMIWLEIEHAKLTDENEQLAGANEAYYTTERALDVTAAGKEALREALKELAKMARTTDQLDFVHQLNCRGLLK